MFSKVQFGITGCGGVAEEPTNDSSPNEDWAEVGFAFSSVHSHRFISFVIFLVLKCDVNVICKVEFGVGMWEQAVVFEEADILDSEDFGSFAFLFRTGSALFAGPHAEEESANGEFRDC